MHTDDGLSREKTGLLVIARAMRRSRADLRSLAEGGVDTASDSAELVAATLKVPAKLERRCVIERTARVGADDKVNDVKSNRVPKIMSYQQEEVRTRIAVDDLQRRMACSDNISQAVIPRFVA